MLSFFFFPHFLFGYSTAYIYLLLFSSSSFQLVDPTMSLSASLTISGTESLKLESVNVPTVIQNGETAVMTCPYILQDDKLYSMMWYKDHEEFYRFVPRNKPMQHSYHLDGVNVDVRISMSYSIE